MLIFRNFDIAMSLGKSHTQKNILTMANNSYLEIKTIR
ncbi:Uncharacterised protein [Janthinobacterium lividum]|nr:hypothetical protein JANLI_51410 [Janthinobacterium lividum]STS86026.1 Uncharacterised protein [Janthinobacterium lividum]